MKVYRYVSNEELSLLLNKDYNKLGNVFDKKVFKDSNTHKYKDGKKYLHFFKDESMIKYIVGSFNKYYGSEKKYFVCEFDIPKSLLAKTKGKGVYDDVDLGGYDYIHKKITEYAICTDDFNCKWLTSYKEYKDINSLEKV